MKQLSKVKSFSGEQLQFEHASSKLDCQMVFSLFLPEQPQNQKVPMLLWLSGLTCTDQNFVTKAGAQKYAAEHGMAILCADTSPRGEHVPDDPEGAWDFGLGAGFYVNATESPWQANYQMKDYILLELLPEVIQEFPIDETSLAISGHSMGGHGALTIGLSNPSQFKSISAFAPIVAPMQCPWGHKAFENYLGTDRETWKQYDACELLQGSETQMPILIDQGSQDGFLEEQLKPELIVEASKNADYPITMRMQEGYDHSYFFIASFIESHIAFHAKHLV